MLTKTTYMLVAMAARLLSTVGAFLLIARAWTPEQFGVFMYPYALAAVLSRIVDYGFALQLARELGPELHRRGKIVLRALHAKLLLLGPLVLATGVVGVVAVGDSLSRALLVLLTVDAALSSFALFLAFPLRAQDAFDAEARTAIIGNLAFFVVVLALCAVGSSPLQVAIGFVVARAVTVLVAYRAYIKAYGALPGLGVDLRETARVLRTGLPFGVHVAIGTLGLQIDTIIMQPLLGPEAVGVFQAGMRLLLASLLVADAMNNVYLAELARLARRPSRLSEIGTRMTRHLVAVGSLVAGAILVAGPSAVGALFGSKYYAVIPLLPLFAAVSWIRYVGVSFGSVITVCDRQALRAAGVVGVLVLSIILNFALLPRFGIAGALYSSLIAHIVLYAFYAAATFSALGSWMISSRAAVLGVLAVIALAVSRAPAFATQAAQAALGVGLILCALVVGFSQPDWRAVTNRFART